MAVSADPKLRAEATQSLHSPDPLAVRAMLCGIGGIALGEFVKAVFLAEQICQLNRTRSHSGVKQLRRASTDTFFPL
jgi:hypothetical protein